MPIKIKDLSGLKDAFHKRSLERSLALIERAKYLEAIVELEKFDTKTKIPPDNRLLFGEVYYQAAKIRQGEGNMNTSFGYLNKAVKYNDKLFLAKERLHLLKTSFEQQTDTTVTVKGDRITVPYEKLREVDLQLFRNSMRIACATECKHPLGESPYNCAVCKNLVRNPVSNLPVLDQIESFHTVGIYRWRGDKKANETYSQLLREFKNGDKQLAKPLARLLSDYLMKKTCYVREIDLLTSVPVDPARKLKRGYSPPSLLAKHLSKFLSIPFIDHLLKKKTSPHSRELGYREVSNIFSVMSEKEKRIEKRQVLLIDDVTTRGYTLSSCARCLKDLKAHKVFSATLAQSESTLRERKAKWWMN